MARIEHGGLREVDRNSIQSGIEWTGRPAF